MAGKTIYRGVVNAVPGIPEKDQRELIAKYEPDEIYVLNKEAVQDDLIFQMRPPKAIVVSDVALLAVQKGTKADRCESLLWFKRAIHKKGGFLVDARTGLRSDNPKDWVEMRKIAAPMLGRIAKGTRSAANAKRGADPYVHTDKHIMTMLRIMESKRYTNDEMRIEAIRAHGVKPVPKRTWLLTRLHVIARERGLLS